jgi:2-oxoisovalerate dehydrogenase E2 component (dihydrolipoyl transacylase)
MTTFNLPDLGEGLVEAEIVTWHVSAGDHVITDQPLVSVETDKAVVEIPSPYSGTVGKLYAASGDILETGAPLVDIKTSATEDTGAVVGDLERAAPEPPPLRAAARPTPVAAATRVSAAPAIRRLAKQLGVDLATISGSGPGGTILSLDVQNAVEPASGNGEPLRGVRRAMAKAMAKSGSEVVPATLTDWADIHLWPVDQNPTLRLVRAIAVACATEPALNAWFDGTRRTLHSQVDLALAIDTPDGLFAPVLNAVENISSVELASRIADLKKAVQARSLTPQSLKGATITLSNFGMIGGEYAALVVSTPQVAILGAGRIHDVVLAIDGTPTVRRVLPLSLTFDHRAVTGGEAARFMAAVCGDLAQPD